MSTTQQQVIFQNGQFVVEEQSCAVDLMPDIDTSKRIFAMLQQQFDKCAANFWHFVSPFRPPPLTHFSDAVHREDLLQLLPQINPSVTTQHFNQLMDQMFSGFKVGGDMEVMTSSQVDAPACTRLLHASCSRIVAVPASCALASNAPKATSFMESSSSETT